MAGSIRPATPSGPRRGTVWVKATGQQPMGSQAAPKPPQSFGFLLREAVQLCFSACKAAGNSQGGAEKILQLEKECNTGFPSRSPLACKSI